MLDRTADDAGGYRDGVAVAILGLGGDGSMRNGERHTEVAGGRHAPRRRSRASVARPRWWRRHVALLVTLDAVAALVAVALSRLSSFGLDPADLEVRGVTVPYAALAAALVPAWLSVLATSRCYDVGPFGRITHETRRIVRAGANLLAVVAVAYYVLHLEKLARGFLATTVPLAVVLTLALRPLARSRLRALRRRGQAMRHALIVGSSRSVGELVARTLVRPEEGLCPLAACLTDGSPAISTPAGPLPVMGGPEAVCDALSLTRADTLVVAGGLPPGRVRSLAWQLEGAGVDVLVVPTTAASIGFDVRPMAGLPLVFLERAPPAPASPVEPVTHAPGASVPTGRADSGAA